MTNEAISSFRFFISFSSKWQFKQGLFMWKEKNVGLHNWAFTIGTKGFIFIALKWKTPFIKLFTGSQLLRTFYILNISINFVYIWLPIVRPWITIEILLLLLNQLLLLLTHCKLAISLPLQAIYILQQNEYKLFKIKITWVIIEKLIFVFLPSSYILTKE